MGGHSYLPILHVNLSETYVKINYKTNYKETILDATGYTVDI